MQPSSLQHPIKPSQTAEPSLSKIQTTTPPKPGMNANGFEYTDADIAAFRADTFMLGLIPEFPPPPQYA
jgi:hypothetical protein